MVLKTSGRQLIMMYLGRTAGSGKLSDAILPGGCSVAAGVDVFAVSPQALPFKASHRGENGEVWGYFAAARMADRIQPAPGGCWVLCGKEKPYELKGETAGYRSRFAFYVTRVEGDGKVMWAQTRWQMKEYRLNKNHTLFRQKKLQCPDANMDFVIRKFFAKPAVPLPPPAQVVGVRAVPAKTKPKPKPKPKKVVPPPLPPYARSEGGEALQQGGSSLPPRSVRPPRPPQVVAKPVGPPPTPQVTAKPMAPPPTPQVVVKPVAPQPTPQVITTPVATPPTPRVIAKQVAPPPTPRVTAKQVAPPPTPWVITKQVAPPPTPRVIAKQVAPQPTPRVIAKPLVSPPPPQFIATAVVPPLSPQVTATAVVPPLSPQVIATALVPQPLPACSSQDEATSSHAHPHNPNANMELVERAVPAKPVILAPPPAQSAGARVRLNLKPHSGFWIITRYLGPKAVHGHNPGAVAEGVDVFAVSPDALPSPPMSRTQNGEMLGYFFAPKPTTSMRLVHGGCWMRYGGEKKYSVQHGEVVAFHRKFAFHAARVDGDGKSAWEQTPWLMKEYQMNKAALSARTSGGNMDLVVLKVFTKPVAPPPPPPRPAPAWSGNAAYPGYNYPSVKGADCSRPVVPQPLSLRPPPMPPACTIDLQDCIYSLEVEKPV